MISTKKIPDTCDRLPASHPSEETLDLLMLRRSLTVKDMSEPGPSEEQLNQILTIGARVPDHKKQAPWRFLTFEGEARTKFGKILRQIFEKNNPGTDPDLLTFEEMRFLRAPLIIAVISKATPENPKVPEWEQILSAGAVCQNVLLAANAMGYAGQWLSEWYAYDPEILKILKLSKEERIAGFIYIGSTDKEPTERSRPELHTIVEKWIPEN
ncbi:MAG: nitroreductase [Alphaproteobacteria bacterium]|nr:nitroreductase [Alphaproteobacteria bacterium]HPF47500.1 nitroreductase [Emcibacteraceae bacterium]